MRLHLGVEVYVIHKLSLWSNFVADIIHNVACYLGLGFTASYAAFSGLKATVPFPASISRGIRLEPWGLYMSPKWKY